MTTFADFLPAILADPADDAPRLVAADWLEERDDPRGEFIRLQCELARLEAAADEYRKADGPRVLVPRTGEQCGEWKRLLAAAAEPLRRERELLYRHKTRWLAPWRDGDWHGITNHTDGPRLTLHLKPEWTDVGIGFRRGFVDAVTLSTAAFLDNAAALFAAAPVTRVTLADRRPYRRTPRADTGPHPGTFRWLVAGPGRTRLPADPASLPHAVGKHLRQQRPDALRGATEGEGLYDYRSEDVALADLSAACVEYGRGLANLPGLAPAGGTP